MNPEIYTNYIICNYDVDDEIYYFMGYINWFKGGGNA